MKVSLVKASNYPLAGGLLASLLGILLVHFKPGTHPLLMLSGAALSFPTAMFILFSSGYKRGGDREGAEALLAVISSLSALAAVLAISASLGAFKLAGVVSLLALLGFSLKQLEGKWRWPHWLLLTYPPALGLLTLLASVALGWGVLETGLALGLYYAAPMITSVSLLTSSRNYGSSWAPHWVLPPLALSVAGLVLFSLGHQLFSLASGLHLLIHFLSIRLWGARGFWTKLRSSKNPYYRRGGVALITSHLSALFGAVVFTLLALGVLPPGEAGWLLALIHGVYLGFMAPHIHYHAITMLPQITPLKPTRLFLLPALAMWPLATLARLYEPGLGLVLVIAALLGLLAEFRPRTLPAWLFFLASRCSMPHACRYPTWARG